jgi:hypothetical protein
MQYHVLAYGSSFLPDINRQMATVCMVELWKYPYFVVMTTRELDSDAIKTAVQFREMEMIH